MLEILVMLAMQEKEVVAVLAAIIRSLMEEILVRVEATQDLLETLEPLAVLEHLLLV